MSGFQLVKLHGLGTQLVIKQVIILLEVLPDRSHLSSARRPVSSSWFASCVIGGQRMDG